MSYNLTKPLPSCFVERKLLLELENYVKRKATEIAGAAGKTSVVYEFIIADSLGVETLSGVDDYKRAYFPDDIKRLAIKCRAKAKNSLDIEISFAETKNDTKLEIVFDGGSARELVTGIATELVSTLNSYRTRNNLFHPPANLRLLLMVITMSLGMAMLPLSGEETPTMFALQGSVLGLIVLALAYSIATNLKPYSTFETRKNERRHKQISWLLLGLLGFILFTVIGVYFRVKLFGF